MKNGDRKVAILFTLQAASQPLTPYRQKNSSPVLGEVPQAEGYASRF